MYDAIFVSPHSDDVILSCYGRILDESSSSNKSLLLTVFGSHDKYPHRFDENKQSIKNLPLEEKCLHIPELTERASGARIFFPSTSDSISDRVYHTLSRFLKKHATKNKTRVYFPLFVGNHQDHMVVHNAGKRLHDEENYQVIFYGDTPYQWYSFYNTKRTNQPFSIINFFSDLHRRTVILIRSKKNPIWWILYPFILIMFLLHVIYMHLFVIKPIENFKTEEYELDSKQLESKLDSVMAYQSQLHSLFGTDNRQDIAHVLQSYPTERYFYPSGRVSVTI